MQEQLTLDSSAREEAAPCDGEMDLVKSILTACGGDPLVAIRELLADADFLREQLYTASCIMSSAMARGWKPKYERTT